MKRFQHLSLSIAAIVTSLSFATPVFATAVDDIKKGLSGAGAAYQQGGASNDPIGIIGRLIGYSLQFLGVILLVYLITAGFLWMTAGGDDAKVKKAREMIKNAVIGIVIVAASMAIANFVLGGLQQAFVPGAPVEQPVDPNKK